MQPWGVIDCALASDLVKAGLVVWQPAPVR